MTCSSFSKSDPVRATKELIDRTVSNFRNRGLTRAIALDEASAALGITPRKAKSLLYDETFAVSETEYRSISERFRAHLRDEAAILSARAAAALAEIRQLEIANGVQHQILDRRVTGDRRSSDRRFVGGNRFTDPPAVTEHG